MRLVNHMIKLVVTYKNEDCMKYFAGIDGGGTKTKLWIVNDQKKIVYQSDGGPTSLDTVSIQTIQETIHQLFATFDRSIVLEGLFAGIGGVSSVDDRQRVIKVLQTLPHVHASTALGVDNDVKNALVGSLGHDSGMVLIAGTGSAVYGHHQGKTWRAGGISAKEGDSGSAFDLGFQALRHLGKVLDGRCKKTAFSQDISVSIKVSTFEDLAYFFNHTHRTMIASLSPIVTKHFQDPYALQIMNQGIQELVLMVNTVYQKLEFKETELGLVGSLANADTYYKKALTNALLRELPKLTLVSPPKFEPVFGSVLLAMQLKHH